MGQKPYGVEVNEGEGQGMEEASSCKVTVWRPARKFEPSILPAWPAWRSWLWIPSSVLEIRWDESSRCVSTLEARKVAKCSRDTLVGFKCVKRYAAASFFWLLLWLHISRGVQKAEQQVLLRIITSRVEMAISIVGKNKVTTIIKLAVWGKPESGEGEATGPAWLKCK